MNSCLYFGEVSHHRKAPRKHDLRYDIFMAHLFLDELDDVFQGRWFWSANRSNLGSFHRSDYHRPEIPCLADAVRKTMSDQLGKEIKRQNLHHHPPANLWILFQSGEFLFPLERGAYPTDCLNGGNHQHALGEKYAKCFEGKQAPIQTVATMNSARNFMYLLSSG